MPTYAVDDGFLYGVPDGVSGIGIGSVVRIPLSGRRVRGFIVALDEEREGEVKEITSVTGDLPVFDGAMLDTLRWAALHYGAPLAAMLRMAMPPNAPRREAGLKRAATAARAESSQGRSEGSRARRRRDIAVVWRGATELADHILELITVSGTVGSQMVILPTITEAERIASVMRAFVGPRVVTAHSRLSGKALTAAWSTASTEPGVILVGTREISLWKVAGLSTAVIVEEGRRAMKAPQTPTVHVREIMARRSTAEGFALRFLDQVPTVELIAGPSVVDSPRERVWPLVEIVDRTEEPPGPLITERTQTAIRSVVKRGGTVFVCVPRRGFAPAYRCRSCSTLRRCGVCGAGARNSSTCARCGAALTTCAQCGGQSFRPVGLGIGRAVDELSRIVGPAAVASAGDGHEDGVDDGTDGGQDDGKALVRVGSERDIVGAEGVDLSVALDFDRMLLAAHYRAGEDTLRSLARVASLVRRGPGRRCLVETDHASDAVFAALRRGDPMEYLVTLAEERRTMGFPPVTQMMAIEVAEPPPDAHSELVAAMGSRVSVMGPAEAGRGRIRWLVQADDLTGPKAVLRGVVQGWRDGGARVRIDADPIDL